jgi:hypothetical protein
MEERMSSPRRIGVAVVDLRKLDSQRREVRLACGSKRSRHTQDEALFTRVDVVA